MQEIEHLGRKAAKSEGSMNILRKLHLIYFSFDR